MFNDVINKIALWHRWYKKKKTIISAKYPVQENKHL